MEEVSHHATTCDRTSFDGAQEVNTIKGIDNKHPDLPSITTLDAVVAAVPDFVYTFDLEGRFTYANPALHALLQRGPGQMVGLNFHDLGYPHALATTLQAQIQEVVDTAEVVRADTMFESAFGVGYYEYIFVPIFDNDRQVLAVAGTTRDITQRRRNEDALRESRAESERLVAELQAERAKLRTLFEQAPAFQAMLTGPNFVIEFANEDYYRLVGRRELIGKPVAEALPEIVEQGWVDLLKQVFDTGEPFVGRGTGVVLDRNDGTPGQRYVDFIYQPIKDGSGATTSILVHGVDVTDQVLAQREVERLYAEMEERVRERTLQLQIANQDLEGFTYSVSHDLRAPLRAIVSSSSILLEDYGPKLDADGQHELRRQVAAANKLAVLIDDLLKLSRLGRQEIQRRPIDVTEMAMSIAADFAATDGRNQCEFVIQPGMHAIADLTSFRLLLVNLVENACKFSPIDGRVEIGQTIIDEKSVLWVKDNGVGFDMQYAHKVFLPFERLVTESQFPGTGIGLANVKRVVERHGGRIWVDSTPGKGTTVFFTLTS